MMKKCFSAFIFDDPGMRENDMNGIMRRVNIVFRDKAYIENLKKKENNWLDEKVDVVTKGIIDFLKEYE